MYSRVLIFLVVVGLLCWLVFADYLFGLWLIDKDHFWSIISAAGIIFILSSFWLYCSAIENDADFRIAELEKEVEIIRQQLTSADEKNTNKIMVNYNDDCA